MDAKNHWKTNLGVGSSHWSNLSLLLRVVVWVEIRLMAPILSLIAWNMSEGCRQTEDTIIIVLFVLLKCYRK